MGIGKVLMLKDVIFLIQPKVLNELIGTLAEQPSAIRKGLCVIHLLIVSKMGYLEGKVKK